MLVHCLLTSTSVHMSSCSEAGILSILLCLYIRATDRTEPSPVSYARLVLSPNCNTCTASASDNAIHSRALHHTTSPYHSRFIYLRLGDCYFSRRREGFGRAYGWRDVFPFFSLYDTAHHLFSTRSTFGSIREGLGRFWMAIIVLLLYPCGCVVLSCWMI